MHVTADGAGVTEARVAEVVAALTAPGTPFELVEHPAPGGPPIRNFLRRERSIVELLARAARRGDREFLVDARRRMGFESLVHACWGVGESLRAQFGLGRREGVAVLGPNSIDWVLAAMGAASAGGFCVALNAWWAPEELANAFDDAQVRFVVVDHSMLETLAPLLDDDRLKSVEYVFVMRGEAPAGMLAFDDLVVPQTSPPDVEIDEDDPFAILYTSGTTGFPKGCITTHRGTLAQLRSLILASLIDRELGGARPQSKEPTHERVLLATSPLFHAAGLHAAVCSSLATGTKVVFYEGRFDPAAALRLIERERVTVWGAVPTMVHRVVNCPEVATTDLSSLEVLTLGSAPSSPALLEKATAVFGPGVRVANGYGLTENHGPVTMNAGRTLAELPNSVGRPMTIMDVRIEMEDGVAAAPGEIGEIIVRGPTLTPGYWNRPDESAQLVRGGWLHTGDLGFLDDSGFLYVVDRAKDMIIRGAENVYSIEVENCLAKHVAVEEVAVVGIPDDDLGERIKAIVRPRAGSSVTASELRMFAVTHLAKFKVPDVVEFTAEPLPRNATGKVIKGLLRGEGALVEPARESASDMEET